MLRTASGALFGAGADGATPIWVTINVVAGTTVVTPVGLPDLTVMITSGPTVSCKSTCITSVGYVITNASSVDITSKFQVSIQTNGQPSQTITVGGLAAGASQNFVQQFSGSCFTPDCTAQVTVDSSNLVPESNETNNVAEKTIVG